MFKTLLLILIFLLSMTNLLSAEKTIIQAGLTFLPGEVESKIAELKKNPAALREAAVKEIKLKEGDTLIFKNLDNNTHNVYSSFIDLKGQDPGTNKSMLFEKEGTYSVNCMIHPKMKFNVVVGK